MTTRSKFERARDFPEQRFFDSLITFMVGGWAGFFVGVGALVHQLGGWDSQMARTTFTPIAIVFGFLGMWKLFCFAIDRIDDSTEARRAKEQGNA
jgi:uncharacterized membrane protein YsdA (DUF1294 family)